MLWKKHPPPYKLSGDNIKRISIIGFSFLVSGKNFNTFQRGGGICGLAIIYKYIPLNPTGSMYMSAYSLPVILFCSSNPITTTLGGLLFQQGGYVCIFSVLYLRLIFISLILNCNSSWWPAVPTGRLCRWILFLKLMFVSVIPIATALGGLLFQQGDYADAFSSWSLCLFQ